MGINVLLTDGHYKHTYAILRALVSRKLKVGILFNKRASLSYYSRLVSKRFLVDSNIYKDESIYINEIIRILKENQVRVLLPIGNVSNNIVSKYKSKLNKYTSIPVVDYESMQIAQYKNKTFKFADSIGIPIPKTFEVNPNDNLEKIVEEISYPCVIKKVNPQESGVIYCNHRKELKEKLHEILDTLPNGNEYPLIQEYVRGKGTGYYGLYNRGECIAHFMHERIHEYPITGGASTLAKSIYDAKLKDYGDKLLSNLKWHGVAMVEFKKDYDGNYKLMEINPKFWGSLELSFKAGINFPYLDYLVALNKSIPESNYIKDVYFRWILPHDYIWKKHASSKDRVKFKKLKKTVKIYNNLHYDDPLIFIFNFIFTLYKLFYDKKYPHGKINK